MDQEWGSRLSKDSTTVQGVLFDEARKDPREGVRPKLALLRFKLGLRAKREPRFRFYSLYGHLLRKDVLETAFASVARSEGSRTAGVDGVTIDQIVDAEDGVTVFLSGLGKELQERTFHPQAVKRVYIPKANGKQRPLGIPTIRDRVVQTALLLILEPIFEVDFLDCSYGFRPGRSAHDALEVVQANLREGYTEVYDADLQAYFDSIPHDKLMKGLEQRLADGAILSLIHKFLRAPSQEKGQPQRCNASGTPQGGVISPLLANSFLHWFDCAFHMESGPAVWAKARLVRYADDFVVMARYVGSRLVTYIEKAIEGRLGLKINRDKTKVVRVKEQGATLDFLGYRFRYSRSHRRGGGPQYWRLEASPKAQERAREKLRELTSAKYCYMPIAEVVAQVNVMLRGWFNYFSKGHPANVRWNLIRFAENRMVRHLRRRSQRPYQPPKGANWYRHIHELGLMEYSAKQG